MVFTFANFTIAVYIDVTVMLHDFMYNLFCWMLVAHCDITLRVAFCWQQHSLCHIFSYDDFKAQELLLWKLLHCICNVLEKWWWCFSLSGMIVSIIPIILQVCKSVALWLWPAMVLMLVVHGLHALFFNTFYYWLTLHFIWWVNCIKYDDCMKHWKKWFSLWMKWTAHH